LVIPESFLVTDALLVLATNVAAGLEVRESTIAEHVAEAMPFLATERLLMRGVKAGGDRQQLHEVIRAHSLKGGKDLLDRLAHDPEFKRLGVRANAGELDPAGNVGRAPQQVDDFLDRVLPDLMRSIQAAAPRPPLRRFRYDQRAGAGANCLSVAAARECVRSMKSIRRRCCWLPAIASAHSMWSCARRCPTRAPC
jgi:hypothetical protein